ncbi:hypothetical protein BUALT_Bualt07G0031500 [Buddleja alternifolia]|uniref:NB-ARC domain-containing protein n=1 Tax=Buddleja alternifolia TaxID=168488 RepID=A0AAV6XFI8_9LAMI|nr:hypothetical protein BUALT_Bualt07G0031500 [Buddleja alternifolia]
MAVAAYASVINLLHVLDQIQHPVRRRLLPNTKQIETLQEKVHFLQEFLELHSPTKIEGIEDLVKQITEVANEAEDVINSHVVDQLRQEYEHKTDDTNDDHVVNMEFSSSSFCQDIDKVIEKIDSIKEQLLTMVKAEGKVAQEQQPPIVSVRAGSSTLPSRGKSTGVVGFDERLIQIKELLTRDQPNLQIIPIVGMGGIGKTTLARFVFQDKYVVEKFDKRVWFTISQEYSVHEILLSVLHDIGVVGDLKNKTLAELKLQLHQELSGRRYLIVMDDLWSTNGWDDFKSSFPNYRNGSRVMVTTRLNDVAVSLGSQNTYTMDFLDEDNSWNLLCEKAFTQANRSAELEEIGKRIAKSCKGLPLAIVVIGGLLAKSNMTQEYWEFVAKKVNLLVSSENDEDCSKILLLSYNHLPIHLKPCFLYMGFFPEDYESKVYDLTKSWVVEGFLKPVKGKSLEEVANEYLKDLIERNLILVCKRGSLGEIERCVVHDLLRDLCWRESQKEHFASIPKSQAINFIDLKEDFIHEHRCYLCRDVDDIHCYRNKSFGYQLVTSIPSRVADPQCYHHLLVKFQGYYNELPIYTKLRRLFVYTFKELPFVFPSTISQLWNLHTLFIENSSSSQVINLPSEIWKMPQLRNVSVRVGGFYLPQIDKKDFIVQENLHTLVGVNDFTCTKNVVKRIPNLKELKIAYYRRDWSYYCLHNIAKLHKLESLSIGNWKSTFAFPCSLKKLELNGCRIPWEDMTVIASLPNLEILLLYDAEAMEHSSLTHEWINPVEGGFRQLKFLLICGINLKRWRAESIHFPKLEILQLRLMDKLEETPSGIGEIETLRKIEVNRCSSSVVESAVEIYEEQQSFGNEEFQLFIDYKRYQT